MTTSQVGIGLAFLGSVQWFWVLGANPVRASSFFEPPTQSAPPAAVEVDVMEKIQRRIEAENSYSAYLFSGEVFFEQEDLRIPGRGFDFVWKRKYRSREGITTAMGINWDHSYNIYVEASGSDLVLHDGNSRRDTFTPDGGGTTWSAPGLFQQIIQNANGTFTVVFAHQSSWLLAALNDPVKPGRILSITDRNGNSMSFTYDGAGRLVAVTDTLNRAISIAYNLQGYISAVTDFATALGVGGLGRKIQYTYYQASDTGGGAGDLKSVTYPAVVNTPTGNNFPNGKTWTYTYTKGLANSALNHNLITITDAKGQSYLVNSYATTQIPTDLDFDRVIAQTTSNLGGRSFNYFYVLQTPSAENGFAVIKTIVNDRMGNVEKLFFDAGNHLVMRREFTGRAPNPLAQTTETVNRPESPLRPGVDPAYFETKYTYNTDSMMTEVVYPNGNSVQYTYDESNPNPLARGNLLSRLSLPGAIPSDQFEICELWAYDSIFQFQTQHQDGRGFITEWFYDSTGDRGTLPIDCISSLLSEEQPSELVTIPVTIFRAGPGSGTGNQDSTKCPPNSNYGHLVVPSPLPAGRGCVGECFSYEYNSFGQVTARTNRNGRRDEMTYYTSGPMTGYMETYTVDAPNLALATTYEYDAVGNVTRVIDPQGRDTIFIVNALNQVVRRQARQVEFSPGQFVRYERDIRYDENDNVVSIDVQNINENGVLSSNPYFSTAYQYDSLDNLTQISREVDAAHNIVTVYEYDASENLTLTRFGQANAAVNPQPTNTERWLYDERDLLWHQTRSEGDPEQSTTQFDYDGNENLVKVREGLEDPTREHAAHEFTIQRDGFDRRHRTIDPHGNTTQNTYDANHNRTGVVISGEPVQGQSTGSVRLAETQNKFDAWDRNFSVNPKFFRQRPNSFIQDTIDPLSECLIGFDGEGHRRFYCPPPPRTPWQNDFDSADRGTVATTPSASGQSSTTTSYNPSSSPDGYIQTDSSSLGDPEQFFQTILERDGLERLTARINNANDREEFRYDSRNNLVGHTDFNGLFTQYEYDGLNRLTRTIRDMDRDGASAADSPDIINTFAWDDSSRITTLADDNGNTTTYTYDPLDRVTAITYADGTQQLYEYDIFGNVTEFSDANGTVVVNQYDKLNRLVSRTITPGPGVAADTTQVTYKYDGLSRVVFAQDNDSTVVRQYDSYGNVIEETIAFGQIECGNGVVEPGEECEPPDAGATCSEFCRWTVGDCCTEHPTAGCSHPAIEECVCAQDDECCGGEFGNGTWDSKCLATLEQFECGDCPQRNQRNKSGKADEGTAASSGTGVDMGTTVMLYDVVGNLMEITHPGGWFVSNFYDSASRLLFVTGGLANPIATENYVGFDRKEKRNWANQLETTWSYDLLRRPDEVKHKESGEFGLTVDHRTFGWDSVGNKAERTNILSCVYHDYDYDDAYRLNRAVVDNGSLPSPVITRDTSYFRDGVQNRTAVTGNPDSGAHVGYYRMDSVPEDNVCNQYTLSPGARREYDARGNLVHIDTTCNCIPYADISPFPTGDGIVDLDDLLCLIAGFSNYLDCPGADLSPCPYGEGNLVDLDDMLLLLNAFAGEPSCVEGLCGVGGPTCLSGCVADGSACGDGAIIELKYDYQDRLVEWKDITSGIRHTYRYDAFGRRIAKVVDADGAAIETRYFYGGATMWQVVEEQNGSGNTKAVYMYGSYIDEPLAMVRCGAGLCGPTNLPNDFYFFHADDNYNVFAVTDQSGDVVERYEYDDFGRPTFLTPGGTPIAQSTINNTRLFTGREYDAETDFYHNRTRYYDPTIGRFLMRDQFGVWGDPAESGNAQSYVGNNPWSKVDPFGLETLDVNGEKWRFYYNESMDPQSKSGHQAFGDHYQDKHGNRYYPDKEKVLDKNGKWHDASGKFKKQFRQKYDQYWKKKGPGPIKGFGGKGGSGGGVRPGGKGGSKGGGTGGRIGGAVVGAAWYLDLFASDAQAPMIPQPPNPENDHDRDGIPNGWDDDSPDQWPNEPSLHPDYWPGGDWDRDGFPNDVDPNPYDPDYPPGNWPGPQSMPDRDGDGIPDYLDPDPDDPDQPNSSRRKKCN